jgi:hypothetical protein
MINDKKIITRNAEIKQQILITKFCVFVGDEKINFTGKNF